MRCHRQTVRGPQATSCCASQPKGKDAETEAAKALEGIRAQTDTLQHLAGKSMNRLTRYVTQPKPADEGMMALVNAMANLTCPHLRYHLLC